jgi:hypothetical protein
MNDRVAESAIDRRAARIRDCRIADGACTFLDESTRYALSDRAFSPLVAVSGLVLWVLVIATVVLLGRRNAQ